MTQRKHCQAPKFASKVGRRLYLDEAYCRDDDTRVAAVGNLVDHPKANLNDIRLLLRSAPHRYSRDVHFTLLICLPSHIASTRKALLAEIERYLMTVRTTAAYAPWIAGDVLAHWADGPEATGEEIEILCRCITEAPFVAGRLGALHGLQHVLDDARAGSAVIKLIGQVAKFDRSAKVRNKALYTLQRGGCWHQKRFKLCSYAHRLAKRIAESKRSRTAAGSRQR